jgi:hypothetical protein
MGRWSVLAARLSAAAASDASPSDVDERPSRTDKNDITTKGGLCWWDGPPWDGTIETDEFRAIVAAYIAAHGVYTPDLPTRKPALLRRWCAARAGVAERGREWP